MFLLGESVPVTKTPPHESTEIYNPNIHKRHTLFSGTHIIQARFYGDRHILARVMRTGFYTSKGALVKSILYPQPINLKFYRDCMKFVLFLFTIAVFGMAYTFHLYVRRKVSSLYVE